MKTLLCWLLSICLASCASLTGTTGAAPVAWQATPGQAQQAALVNITMGGAGGQGQTQAALELGPEGLVVVLLNNFGQRARTLSVKRGELRIAPAIPYSLPLVDAELYAALNLIFLSESSLKIGARARLQAGTSRGSTGAWREVTHGARRYWVEFMTGDPWRGGARYQAEVNGDKRAWLVTQAVSF